MEKLQFKCSSNSRATGQIKMLYWDKKYTMEEVAHKLDVPFWRLYDFMNKHNIKRRDRSEAGYLYNRMRPQFNIKSALSIAEAKLKIAGCMLYWAEGTLKHNTVDFANCNPQMIRIFLKFLREICGVKEERLRVYICLFLSRFRTNKIILAESNKNSYNSIY